MSKSNQTGPDSLLLQAIGIVMLGMVAVGLFVWFVQ